MDRIWLHNHVQRRSMVTLALSCTVLWGIAWCIGICKFTFTPPRNVRWSIARFIWELRGCNLYGVVARVVITGLGVVTWPIQICDPFELTHWPMTYCLLCCRTDLTWSWSTGDDLIMSLRQRSTTRRNWQIIGLRCYQRLHSRLFPDFILNETSPAVI